MLDSPLPDLDDETRRRTSVRWSVLIALAVMIGAALLLRFGTDVRGMEATWDEPLMRPIIVAIVEEGWSVRTAIDFEDTKGPVFFWIYAALADVFGDDIDVLRLVTVACFVLCAVPLGIIAARLRLGAAETAMVAACVALLPYHAVLGQLFMSEASFVLGGFGLMLVFLWGMDESAPARRRFVAPILFGLVLTLLLHHRPHAVVYAGAATLIATRRDGRASWPWWTACFVAGLLRLPLYFHWGGLVSPSYQYRMGLGVRLDSLTYVAISLLPCTVVLLWPALRERRWRAWLAGAAVAGLALGLFAVPTLGLAVDGGRARYMGAVATALRPLDGTPILSVIFAVLATLGVAALMALALLTIVSVPRSPRDLVDQLAGWSILVGWVMYGATRGAVFDRYVLPFIILLPFVLVRKVPRWLFAVQMIGLFGILVKLMFTWLR